MCAEMPWVDWEMTDLPGGFMYCCSLQEAAAVLEEISSLGLAAPSGLVQVIILLPVSQSTSGLMQAPGAAPTTTAVPTPAAACQARPTYSAQMM